MVRSYRGYYCGLSIRLREFDSPTHRQYLLGYSLVWSKATVFEIVNTGSNPVTSAKFISERCYGSIPGLEPGSGSSTLPSVTNIILSSSIGKDDSLSSCKDGFDSRTEYQVL